MGGSKGRQILVTGALGQIGMELLHALSEKFGAENIVATDIRDSEELEKSGINFLKLDVLDFEKLENIIKEFNIDEVYHLAAILSASGEKNPQLCWKINMDGLLNVLELSRKYKFRIFAPSSIAVFGSDVGSLALQNSPLNPSTIYGVTKVAGELMAEYYHSVHGVDIRGLRYPGLISWKVMPGGGTTDYAVEIFHKAVSSEKYVCFVEKDTRLPMMYMDDAIRATLQLMDAPSSDLTIRGGYNLPSLNFTAEELYFKILKQIPGFECTFAPDHRQEYANSWPDETDGTLSEQDWGFKLEYDLDTMCAKMIESLS
jgi:nucleoside-diphosphate-sugar epimerase|tara:strand:- start:5046 stop:5990 length:945 start_codon:yes stop_codon:yes gene_type:complete